MTYEEWKGLTESQRAKLKKEWIRPHRSGGTPLYDLLAQEAAKDFRQQMSSDPRILDAQSGIEGDGEPVIAAITVVGDDFPDNRLPKEFFGFRVVRLDFLSRKRSYLKTWETMFAHVLGWSVEQILEWAKQREKFLNGLAGPFYHREPSYYAASAIIDEKFGSALTGASLLDLRAEIINALSSQQGKTYKHPDLETDFDWGLARNKVSSLIAELL